MKHVHVSSSTEGYFVINDDNSGKKEDIISGPYASKTDAEKYADDWNDRYHLAQFSGACLAWSDGLDAIKTRVLLPLATATEVLPSLQAQFDFDEVDHIVCKMRELVLSYQADLDNRIHGR